MAQRSPTKHFSDFQKTINALKYTNQAQISDINDHPGELIDSICWELFKRPPRIVIQETSITNKELITTQLEKYVGFCIQDLETSLHPGNASESGFILESQSLVDVIWNDLIYLDKIHVSRYQLADYLEIAVLYNSIKAIKEMEKEYELSEATKEFLAYQEQTLSSLFNKYQLERKSFTEFLDSNFEFQLVSYAHKQQDPFHPSLDNPSVTASTEYFLLCKRHPSVAAEHRVLHSSQWPSGTFFRFSDLSLALIRRFGFFQGPGVPHRLDPKELSSCFGLLSTKS